MGSLFHAFHHFRGHHRDMVAPFAKGPPEEGQSELLNVVALIWERGVAQYKFRAGVTAQRAQKSELPTSLKELNKLAASGNLS